MQRPGRLTVTSSPAGVRLGSWPAPPRRTWPWPGVRRHRRTKRPAVTVGMPGAGWVRMSLHHPAAIPTANTGSPGRHCHCPHHRHGAAPCPICCHHHAGRAHQGPRHLTRTPSRGGRIWAMHAWFSHPFGDRKEEKLWHKHLRHHRPASRENMKVL